MTRINLVPVRELSSKHLVAEYRELPRVFGLIEKWQARNCPPVGVPSYTMGKGHVKFFYDKASWLVYRFDDLVHEMQRRGMEPQYLTQLHRLTAIGRKGQLPGYWVPGPQEVEISRQRILEKLELTKKRLSK